MCKSRTNQMTSAVPLDHFIKLQSSPELKKRESTRNTHFPHSHHQPSPNPNLRAATPLEDELAHDVLDQHDRPAVLRQLIVDMFAQLNLLSTFEVPEATFHAFLDAVERSYHGHLPFHNFLHAVDVTRVVFALLRHTRLGSLLRPIDAFSLLVAALVHDVDHPGVSNAFLAKTDSPLVVKYTGRGPLLESHHIDTAIDLISRSECDITVGLTSEQRDTFMGNLRSAILATDMATHFGLMKEFEVYLNASSSSSSPALLGEAEEERGLLMRLALHIADISNPARRQPIARRWSDLVMTEFLAQGDAEKARGWNVSFPWMDRSASGPQQEEMSIGFLQAIIVPMFKMAASQFPEMQSMADHAEANLEYWRSEKQRYTEAQQQQQQQRACPGAPSEEAAEVPLSPVVSQN